MKIVFNTSITENMGLDVFRKNLEIYITAADSSKYLFKNVLFSYSVLKWYI